MSYDVYDAEGKFVTRVHVRDEKALKLNVPPGGRAVRAPLGIPADHL